MKTMAMAGEGGKDNYWLKMQYLKNKGLRRYTV
jgi:hypothetical protein